MTAAQLSLAHICGMPFVRAFPSVSYSPHAVGVAIATRERSCLLLYVDCGIVLSRPILSCLTNELPRHDSLFIDP